MGSSLHLTAPNLFQAAPSRRIFRHVVGWSHSSGARMPNACSMRCASGGRPTRGLSHSRASFRLVHLGSLPTPISWGAMELGGSGYEYKRGYLGQFVCVRSIDQVVGGLPERQALASLWERYPSI